MALKHKTHHRAPVAVVQRQSMRTVSAQNEREHLSHPTNVLQRPAAALRPADILALQRTVGNRVVQRMLHRNDEDKPIKGHSPGRRETGLPDALKSGVESLSGISMDDVRVHYNSAEPAKLNARAFTHGTDIYLGPNEEEHLPHEAWHVVQQRLGRVQPTTILGKGLPANDDAALEKEADEMGARSLRQQPPFQKPPKISPAADAGSTKVLQRVVWEYSAMRWRQKADFDDKAIPPSAAITENARDGDQFDTRQGWLKTREGVPVKFKRADAGGGGGGGGGGGFVRDVERTRVAVEAHFAALAAARAAAAAPETAVAGVKVTAAAAAAAPARGTAEPKKPAAAAAAAAAPARGTAKPKGAVVPTKVAVPAIWFPPGAYER